MLNSYRDPVDNTAQSAALVGSIQDQVLVTAGARAAQMSQCVPPAAASRTPSQLGEPAARPAEDTQPPGHTLSGTFPAAPVPLTTDDSPVVTEVGRHSIGWNVQMVSGAVMAVAVFADMAGAGLIDDVAHRGLIGGATGFAVGTGWKTVRVVWRRYGPDVVFVRFDKRGR